MRTPFMAALIMVTLGPMSVAWAQNAATATVAEVIEDFVDAGEIPGAVTLFAEDGEIVDRLAVGTANLERDTPMTDDTLFGVMSMTKPITATALMILVDEGKVSLDDPVEKYLPAFAEAKTTSGERVRGLTLRRLLTHSSGLAGDQGCYESLEATASALAARPFTFQPGEKWEYGPSLNVIGRIIEVVSGKPYEVFLNERIFEPLGMEDATFHLSSEQRERNAVLYRKSSNGSTLVPAERWHRAGEPDCVPNPSGGLFATAEDMFRFYQMILNGGELDGRRIVSADAVRQMTTVQFPDLETGFTPGNGWGLGWCIVREPQGVTEALSSGTFGHGGAYGTQGWVDPVNQRIFVLMIQRADLGNADGSEIRRDFQAAAVGALEGN